MLDFNGNEPKEIRLDDGIVLPSSYTRLEYIESTGTQYIDTGYMINENFKYKIKTAITDKRSNTGVYPQIIAAYGISQGSDGKNYTINYSPSTKMLMNIVNYTINEIYSIEFKLGETIVNNTIYENAKTWNGSPYGNVYLFCAITSNSGVPSLFYARARVYYAQIYDGENIVRNFIPARRNSDNEVGLYDIVNNVFYTNQGTGSFVAGNEYKGDNVSKVVYNNTVVWKGLPSSYTRLEYIESTGTQYIDTGIIPNINTKLGTNFAITNINKLNYMGSALSGSKGFFEFGTANNPDRYVSLFSINSESGLILSNYVDNNFHTYFVSNGLQKIDSNEAYNTISNFKDTMLSIYLFRRHINWGSSAQWCDAKIKDCKIWDNDTLVRNFIPAKRNSDNEIGLYDTVNDVFYTNAGTDTFIAGEL